VIDRLEHNTFYARMVLRSNRSRGRLIEIDARPSDSVALALRAEAPIFVEERVFESLKKYESQPF